MEKETASQRMRAINALWMENLGADCLMASPARLEEAFAFAEQRKYSDVYLQVYREGRAWFPSKVAGQEFYGAARRAGFEPLQEALLRARDCGIRVHAWLNAFNLGLNGAAKILADNGEDLLLRDNRGISISRYGNDGAPPDSRADYFTLDAPKLWLDPASPLVREYICTLVAEIIEAAPEIAGVHLDFFRYPYCLPIQPSSRINCGFEFGYGKAALDRFQAGCGIGNAFAPDKRGDLRPRDEVVSLAFDRWRRDAVGMYLPAIRQIIGERILSAACLAWPERAYFSAYQNWRAWIEQSMLDYACIMSYTADDEHFRYLVRQASAFQTKSAKVLAGVGSYLHPDCGQTERQSRDAVECGAEGCIVFSYENLLKQEARVLS